MTIEEKILAELERFGKEVTTLIEEKIIDTKTIDTGDLLRSVSYRVDPETVKLDFSMLEYGTYTDEGTKYIKARKFFKQTIQDNLPDLRDNIAKIIASSIVEEVKKETNQ